MTTMNRDLAKAVAADFAARRGRHETEQDFRKRSLYESQPKFLEIENEIRQLGNRTMTARVQGNESEALQCLTKIAALEQARADYLKTLGLPPDYLELHYDCPDCKDTGYQGTRPCHCFRQAMIDKAFGAFDFGIQAQAENFTAFNANYYSDERNERGDSPRRRIVAIRKMMETYCSAFPGDSQNYIFTGPPGTGKTFMSHCVANNLIDRSFDVVYIEAAHLITKVREAIFNDDGLSDPRHPLKHCDLLIIDDLGAEYTTDFNSNLLYEIINDRLQSGRPMLISSNLGLQEIKKRYDERLSSRLGGNFTILTFNGEDIRIVKKRQARNT